MIEVDETILDTIIEAKKNNKLAFFIGAGFSKNAETGSNKIPLWSDLISDLKKSLNIENETDFLKIAQLYYLKYGEYEYYNKLKKYFELNLDPSEVHKKLFSLLPSLIVTTNWDCILEHTAIEEGLTYDVIASDVDLVKSSYFHKIVKMHGDFQHHNIVFKEDDYLKYSDSFPLLENYLKSILSTHVVVFIGYSYSDIDLKLITKWIETKSKVTPPKYLFSSRYNEAEASYLKNHGIQFLNPKTKDKAETKDIILDFFNIVSEKNELLRYKKTIEKDDLSFDEKLSLIKLFYEKIKNLNELKSIFPKQIREIFSNSTIEYHIDCYALYLISDTILTYDNDELVRNYYKVIKEIIIDNKNKKNEIKNSIINIFYIFKKANIVFLKFSSKDTDQENNFININEYIGENGGDNDRLYLDFKSKGSSNDLIFLEDYKGLSKQSIINIYSNIKERSYINLAINSFNNEIALRLIKSDYRNNAENHNEIIEENSNKNDVKIFKDYFDFYGLTDKKEYNFINSFLNFNVIDGIYRSTNERIKTNIKKMKTIKNGGLCLDSSFTEEELTIQSLLDFIYKNNIAMEGYKEVKSIFENHIEYKIKLIKINYSDCDEKIGNVVLNFNKFSGASNTPNFRLNIMDLFVILNFSDSKKLIEILRIMKNLLVEEKIKDVKDLLKVDLNLRDYLMDCFENIKSKQNTFNNEKIMHNLILMSSLCDWGGWRIYIK